MPTAEQQANAQWKRMLETYEDPGLDEAVDAELWEYIGRRRSELGDD
jgi:trimethylamine:corrinoid methyltransferase-like protein